MTLREFIAGILWTAIVLHPDDLLYEGPIVDFLYGELWPVLQGYA